MNTRIYDAIRIVVSNKMVTALLVSSRGWNFVVRMKFFDDTRISLLCQSTRITEPIPRVTVNYRYPRKIDNSVTENATTLRPPPFFFIFFRFFFPFHPPQGNSSMIKKIEWYFYRSFPIYYIHTFVFVFVFSSSFLLYLIIHG